jgi:DNA-directed RNA polymerase subunit RPC12/RpoP
MTGSPIKHNIYKLDDICLIISWFILVILIIRLFVLIPDLVNGYISGRRFILIGILGGSFIFLQAVGRNVRKKERRLQQIISVILDYKSISVANLSRVTGLSLTRLKPDLIEIEKHSRPHIVIEGDRISLRIGDSVSVSYTCTSCGASASDDFRVESPYMKCAYCGSPIELQGVEDIREDVLRRAQETSESLRENIQLNIPLLVILFVAFWPGALIYLISFYMKKNKDSALFNEVRQRFNQQSK